VTRFRRRHAAFEAAELSERLTLWAGAHRAELEAAEPDLPDALEDRAQDGWEALIAVADQAGSDWPARAREAAVALSNRPADDDASYGVRLLADIRAAFRAAGQPERITSADLVAALVAVEDAPWPSLRGKPLDPTGLARRLRPFKIKPSVIRFGDSTARGYERDWFTDAWHRYLTPPPPETDVPPPPEADVTRNTALPVTPQPLGRNGCDAVSAVTPFPGVTGSGTYDESDPSRPEYLRPVLIDSLDSETAAAHARAVDAAAEAAS